MLKQLERLHPVHEQWFEIGEGNEFDHVVRPSDLYTGALGGGASGPSSGWGVYQDV